MEGWKDGGAQSSGSWSVRVFDLARLDCASIDTSLILFSAFISLMRKLSSHVPVSLFFGRLSIRRFMPSSSL